MNFQTAKIAFWCVVGVFCAIVVTMITSLPTFVDVLTSPAAVIAGVVAGRKSTEWF